MAAAGYSGPSAPPPPPPRHPQSERPFASATREILPSMYINGTCEAIKLRYPIFFGPFDRPIMDVAAWRSDWRRRGSDHGRALTRCRACDVRKLFPGLGFVPLNAPCIGGAHSLANGQIRGDANGVRHRDFGCTSWRQIAPTNDGWITNPRWPTSNTLAAPSSLDLGDV